MPDADIVGEIFNTENLARKGDPRLGFEKTDLSVLKITLSVRFFLNSRPLVKSVFSTYKIHHFQPGFSIKNVSYNAC